MRKIILGIVSLIALAACGSSTAPVGKAGDPSLLITNNLDHDWVFISWQDGNNIFGRDSVAPRTANQCVRFLAQPDSAKWVITATETTVAYGPLTSSQGGVFFNPASRPAWNVTVNSQSPDSPAIRAVDIDPALAC